MKLYAAYGSNINMEQMAHRCPDAVVVGKGYLHNYELAFQGTHGYGVATVKPKRGRRVPILLWSISEMDEQALDIYEGWPRLYRKEVITFSITQWIGVYPIFCVNDKLRRTTRLELAGKQGSAYLPWL